MNPKHNKKAHQVLKALDKICTKKVYTEIFEMLNTGGGTPSHQTQFKVPIKRIERNHYNKIMKEMKSTGITLVSGKKSLPPNKIEYMRIGKINERKIITLNTLNKDLLSIVSTFLIELDKTLIMV